MIRKTLILLSLALCVLGDGHHAVSEQRIKIRHKDHKDHHGHHGELSHIGSKEPEHHDEYAWSYPSYEFSYSVHDPHTHDNKGQHESREGDEVKGEYWLIQPDGRKRTVTYHADKHNGFHATVHYSDHDNHIVEHHGYKDDDHKEDKKDDDDDDDDKKEKKDKKQKKKDKKKEKKEKKEKEEEDKKKEKKQKEEEDDKKEEEDEKKEEKDEKKEEKDEKVEEAKEEEDEERGGEESRGNEGGVIRWGYGPSWDHKDKHRSDRRDHDEGRRGHGHDRDDKHDYDDDRDSDDDYKYDIGAITVYGKLGPYGRRDDKQRDEKRKEEDRDREESLLWEERRKFDERRGYPSNLTPYFGHASRINPRFYRPEQQRKTYRRN